MTAKIEKPKIPEFKPKKLSPFVSDPFNTRGGKGGGKGGISAAASLVKGGNKAVTVSKKLKGGSGGDR